MIGSGDGPLRSWLVSQFANPRGVAGRMAGWVMSRRPSNRLRNGWTIERLGLRPSARVLEIGFGPGVSLEHIASLVGQDGFVAGIDLSATMRSQALRRNRVAVRSGRMDLRVASVATLPDFGTLFDAVVAVNTVGFWPDPVSQFRAIHDLLVTGGRFAVTMQPRSKGATGATTERVKERIEVQLTAAGFSKVTIHRLDLTPPAVCLVGSRDEGSVVLPRNAPL